MSYKFLVLLIPLYLSCYIVIPKNNNVCKTFIDYYFPEGNDNCYFNPDAALKTREIIKKYAGIVETHEVTTEDGYILTMFRIPRANPKGTILLHHSVATYSHIYLWQGNESLAITLWRNGFDVWLANQRGTSYSDKHVNMTKFDFKYWDFSFHEMAIYDVSSELQRIREKTNDSKVIYFGHSLGATTGLVYSSMKPNEAKEYLKTMVLLGPAAHFRHADFRITIYKNVLRLLQSFTEYFQIGSPFLNRSFLVSVSVNSMRIFPPIQFITAIFIWIFCGFTPQETDPTFFNFHAMIYLNNYSWKTVYHYTQLGDDFKLFDYGNERNWEVYGNSTPPFYPLEEISVPTLIISSYSDALVSPKDCNAIVGRLSSEAAVYGHWKYSELNHLDFHVGLHRKEIFTNRLIDFLVTSL